MPRRMLVVLLALLTLLGSLVVDVGPLAPTGAHAQSSTCLLYAAAGSTSSTSDLYTLNPATGALVSTIGPIGFALTGLAVNPIIGELFGSTSRNSAASPGALVRINPASGAGTLVGPYNQANQTAADLTFSATGGAVRVVRAQIR